MNSDGKERDYQLDYFKEKIEGHDSRIKILETMTNEMMKISLILENQQVSNEKQDATLNRINDNLTQLNYKSDRLGERVDGLEIEVKEQTASNTVKVSDLSKKIGWTILIAVIGGIIGRLASLI